MGSLDQSNVELELDESSLVEEKWERSGVMMLSQRENAESVQILPPDWIQHKDTTYNNDIPSTIPSRLQSDLSRGERT